MSCEVCLAGKFNTDNGVLYSAHDDIGDCFSCDVGKFSNDPNGAITCLPCPEGLISGSGASSCSTCPVGYQCIEGVVNSTCPAGKYSNGATDGCVECDPKYKCPGGSDRIPCPPGSYSFSPSQTACTSCEAGKFQSDEAKESCDDCKVRQRILLFLALTTLPPPPPPLSPLHTRLFTQSQPGHFCPASSIAEIACNIRSTFQANSSSTSCRPCSNCPLGEIMTTDCNLISDRQCSPCVAPAYSEDGLTCKQCDKEGQYSNINSASFCKLAPPGFKPTTDYTGVIACPAGEYSIGGASTCTSCPAGKYSEHDEINGAIGCTACDLGSISSEGSSSCIPCSPPTYSDDSITCKQCDGEGQYSDVNGASFCKTAPAGTKPIANHTNIEICPQNTFSIGASNTCAPCKPGKISKPGASSCIPCPQYETPSNSTRTCECMDSFFRIGIDGTCSCKAGETLMGTSCHPCEKGKWKGEVGVESCNRCDAALKGSITTEAGSTTKHACICPSETYDDSKDACVPTVEGMRTDLTGMTLNTASIEAGFWRSGLESKDIRECPTPEACVGGNSTEEVCRKGHAGPYCALCIDGFTTDPFLLCKNCNESVNDIVWTVLALVLMAGLVFGLFYLVKKKFGQRRKGKTIWKRCKNGVKIIFASSQITASLPKVIPALSLPKSFKEVVKASQILNLNLFTFVPVGCFGGIGYYGKTTMMTAPIIIACATLIFLGFVKRKPDLFTAAIAITYLTLPTITTTVFGLFPCDSFDDGRYRLRVDLSIDCEGRDRWAWEAYGFLMIILFPVGTTLSWWLLLYRKRDRLMREKEERLGDGEIAGIMFLW